MTIQGNGQKINMAPIAKGDIKPTGDVKKSDTAELKEAEAPLKELDGLVLDGKLERDEAVKLVREFPKTLCHVDVAAWKDALEDMDGDKDGAISEQEFIADWMRDHPPGPLARGCGTAHYALQIQMAKMAFNGIDRNDDGKITILESSGLPKPQNDFEFKGQAMRDAINFNEADKDNDGQLTREEFAKALYPWGAPIAMYLDPITRKPVSPITRAFDQIDQDQDGKISVDEAKQFETEVFHIYDNIRSQYHAVQAASDSK